MPLPVSASCSFSKFGPSFASIALIGKVGVSGWAWRIERYGGLLGNDSAIDPTNRG